MAKQTGNFVRWPTIAIPPIRTEIQYVCYFLFKFVPKNPPTPPPLLSTFIQHSKQKVIFRFYSDVREIVQHLYSFGHTNYDRFDFPLDRTPYFLPNLASFIVSFYIFVWDFVAWFLFVMWNVTLFHPFHMHDYDALVNVKYAFHFFLLPSNISQTCSIVYALCFFFFSFSHFCRQVKTK